MFQWTGEKETSATTGYNIIIGYCLAALTLLLLVLDLVLGLAASLRSFLN